MDVNTVVNIGVQRFDKIRKPGSFYIDKTGFIREWWENGSDVTLITRPRRFGKTLNMNMTECFFSTKYADRADLFEGLSIFSDNSDSEKYRQLQGTYPVISLSFANIKAVNYADMEYMMTEVIAALYNANDFLLEGQYLNTNEKEYYRSIKPGMESRVAMGALHQMANFMRRYYDKDVIILLDEYDTPMQEAWMNGYWDEAVQFLRGLFNSTFKTNPYLCRGLITGITNLFRGKFAKQTSNGSALAETIFSDLNNLKLVTVTSEQYATSFGFTEEEVFAALDATGYGSEKQKVKDWYDGFTFGSHADIYNPWSIASFIENNGRYEAYWANTSGNGLVNSLIQQGDRDIKKTMEELICGKSFEAQIDEQVVFSQLGDSADAVWSLLLATGYLKVVSTRIRDENDIKSLCDVIYTLSITNSEVLKMFRNMVRGWFNKRTRTSYNDFIKALLLNDVEAMNEFMNKIALHSFSSFDTAKGTAGDDAPERLASCYDRMGVANGSSLCDSTNLQREADASQFYHGFVLGLIVELAGRFEIRSNRESGFGRYDVMFIPSDREKDDAYVIEFKVHKPRKEADLEETVANAHLQIEEKQYAAELVSRGFMPGRIRKYGFAFRGKECLVG